MSTEISRWRGNNCLSAVRAALAKHTPYLHAPDPTSTEAAVALILRLNSSEEVELLFIKRCEHPLDPWSGQMAFPGGRRDPQDEHMEAVARRETLEEVGLSLDANLCIGRLSSLHASRLVDESITISPFVYQAGEVGELTHNHEVAATVWIPLALFAQPQNVQDYFFSRDPEHRAFPSFRHGPYTIWGLTYRIIAEFMGLLGVDLPVEPSSR